jgi:hypothetical protein
MVQLRILVMPLGRFVGIEIDRERNVEWLEEQISEFIHLPFYLTRGLSLPSLQDIVGPDDDSLWIANIVLSRIDFFMFLLSRGRKMTDENRNINVLLDKMKTKTIFGSGTKFIKCDGYEKLLNKHDVVDNSLICLVDDYEQPTQTNSWKQCTPGFSILGKCWNENCNACGSDVVMNYGFGVFDFSENKHSTNCPSCHKHVNPVVCGFNNCYWLYRNANVDGTGLTDHGWKHVDGNQFCVLNIFNRKWSNSTISIFRKIPGECAICLDDIDPKNTNFREVLEFPCGHSFHGDCARPWLSKNSSCPCCRHNLDS